MRETSLSEREVSILRALASGHSASEIAEELGESRDTVLDNVREILRTFGGRSPAWSRLARQGPGGHHDLGDVPSIMSPMCGCHWRRGEKGEFLAAFGGWKEEVTARSRQGVVNWRRWR